VLYLHQLSVSQHFLSGIVFVRLTCDTRSVAEVKGIPNHRPVGDWEQSLWILIRIGREGGKRRARATQDDGLKAWKGRGYGVRHVKRVTVAAPLFALTRMGRTMQCDAVLKKT
jgi:hypothetical protein